MLTNESGIISITPRREIKSDIFFLGGGGELESLTTSQRHTLLENQGNVDSENKKNKYIHICTIRRNEEMKPSVASTATETTTRFISRTRTEMPTR